MENGQIRDDQITASKAYVAATIGHATGDWTSNQPLEEKEHGHQYYEILINGFK